MIIGSVTSLCTVMSFCSLIEGRSVIFLSEGREVTLPYSYRRTYTAYHIILTRSAVISVKVVISSTDLWRGIRSLCRNKNPRRRKEGPLRGARVGAPGNRGGGCRWRKEGVVVWREKGRVARKGGNSRRGKGDWADCGCSGRGFRRRRGRRVWAGARFLAQSLNEIIL